MDNPTECVLCGSPAGELRVLPGSATICLCRSCLVRVGGLLGTPPLRRLHRPDNRPRPATEPAVPARA
jgi:hypothetical protein